MAEPVKRRCGNSRRQAQVRASRLKVIEADQVFSAGSQLNQQQAVATVRHRRGSDAQTS